MKHFYILFKFLLLATIVTFAACGRQMDNKVEKAADSLKILTDRLTTVEEKELILRARNGNLSKEDKKEIKLIYSVMAENLAVENGHIQFNLSKEDYLKKGLSVGSFYRLQENIRDINLLMIDSMKLDAKKTLNDIIEQCNKVQAM